MTAPAKPAPILPRNSAADRPLLIVMAIMAFMASLALLLTSMSNRATSNWQSELKQSATVQIYVTDGEGRTEAVAQAMTILSGVDGLNAEPVSDGDARDLIRPWIGDVDLPDDLPLPAMIAVEKQGSSAFNAAAIQDALEAEGLSVDVDDHSAWAGRVARAAKAVRVGTSLVLILLLAGSVAATGFATQSAMAVHRKIVKVLMQVGAQDRYVARLFTQQFFIIGAIAGAIGIVGAFIFTFLVSLLFGGGSTSLLPALKFSVSDLIFIGLIPLLFGVVSAIAAGLTSLQVLKADHQSS